MPTNTFLLRNLTIAKRLAVWRLNATAKADATATKKRYSYKLYRHCNAMTVHYFNHFFSKGYRLFFQTEF
jgi:hypothetical protein